MEREKLQAWRDWIRAELESCVSFWLEHGMDLNRKTKFRLDGQSS